MIRVTLTGKTYGIKETLKDLNFRYYGKIKAWIRDFKDTEETKANELANRWNSEGVYGKVEKL